MRGHRYVGRTTHRLSLGDQVKEHIPKILIDSVQKEADTDNQKQIQPASEQTRSLETPEKVLDVPVLSRTGSLDACTAVSQWQWLVAFPAAGEDDVRTQEPWSTSRDTWWPGFFVNQKPCPYCCSSVMAEDTPAEGDTTDIDDTSGDDDSTSEDALAPVESDSGITRHLKKQTPSVWFYCQSLTTTPHPFSIA